MPILQDDPLVTDEQIAEMAHCSTETIRRERRLGRMPPIVRFTPRRHGTRMSALRQWLKDREAKK